MSKQLGSWPRGRRRPAHRLLDRIIDQCADGYNGGFSQRHYAELSHTVSQFYSPLFVRRKLVMAEAKSGQIVNVMKEERVFPPSEGVFRQGPYRLAGAIREALEGSGHRYGRFLGQDGP